MYSFYKMKCLLSTVGKNMYSLGFTFETEVCVESIVVIVKNKNVRLHCSLLGSDEIEYYAMLLSWIWSRRLT